jgi:DNA repair ATPase RecN
VSGAGAPEILEYRFQKDVLDRLESVAGRLPQVVQIGEDGDQTLNFLAIARQMIGTSGESLYTPEDMQAIRERMGDIQDRIKERETEIEDLISVEKAVTDDEPQEPQAAEEETAERLEEIRQSVTDEAVKERVERIGQGGEVDGANGSAGTEEDE